MSYSLNGYACLCLKLDVIKLEISIQLDSRILFSIVLFQFICTRDGQACFHDRVTVNVFEDRGGPVK